MKHNLVQQAIDSVPAFGQSYEKFRNMMLADGKSVKSIPMVEIYADRVSVSNPGLPLIVPERFIDEYVCRNEKVVRTTITPFMPIKNCRK